MTRILIIEDNAVMQTMLNRALIRYGHQVDCVGSLAGAYSCLAHKVYDLAVVDRVLPDGDGTDLLEYLHRESYQTKLLVVSALAQASQRVTGLRAGADDYLVKPFDWNEYDERVKKLLKVRKVKDFEELKIGMLGFYPDSGMLNLSGVKRPLRKREAQILTCLWQHKNQVVSKDRLISDIWANQEDVPCHVTIEVYIRRLRMALGDFSPVLTTVRSLGYMLRDDG